MTGTSAAPERRLRAAVATHVARMGALLPGSAIRALLRFALGDRSLALCLHRVADEPWLCVPELAPCTIAASRLDRLIAILRASRPAGSAPWLTVTFDDGYEDAVEYVEARSPMLPDVEFLVFVCPQKTERRAGFRWDAADDVLRSGGVPSGHPDGPEVDVLGENERDALRGLGERAPYRLAGLEAVRALGRRPNVTLGNHTNGHFRPRSLSDEQARAEYARSWEDFERLFGPSSHFAFPYGTPYSHVEPRHVRVAAALGRPLLWSTEGRPYRREERRPGAVLPRFPVDGTLDERQIATQIAARAVAWRLRGEASTLNERD